MEVIRYYRKYIVENSSLILIAVILAFLFRLSIYFIYTDGISHEYTECYLWGEGTIQYLHDNRIISAIISFIFALAISFYCGYLNTKHKLIRSRTHLPYIFCILFLSSYPTATYMGPQYFSLLFILISTNILLSSYQQVDASGKAYSIGFLLAIASLFSVKAFIYLPLFWIGMRMMRCLKIKTVITSLTGIITVYWIVFFYYLWQNNTDSFFYPFSQFYPILSHYLKNINLGESIVLIICIILLTMTMVSYVNNAYHDKIQTRANFLFLFTTAVYSLLVFIFTNYDPTLNLYIFIFNGVIILSHFFSLSLTKRKVSLFYLLTTLYFIACIHSLLHKIIMSTLNI